MTEPNTNAAEAGLRDDLREARERIELLAKDLTSIDSELEALEVERGHFQLLEQACTALEGLAEAGASDLFWSGFDANGSSADHLRAVRTRVTAFEKTVSEIEERRSGVLEEMQRRQLDADGIAGEILEVEREEERKRLEWLIERDEDIPIEPVVLPWSRDDEDDRYFRKTLAICLLFCLLLGAVLPFVELPIPEDWEVMEQQERLTQLIREEVPPPPPVQETTPLTPDEPVEESKPADEPIVAEEAAPTEEPAPAATKKKVASSGILAFRDQLSGLTETKALDRLGSNARIADPGTVAKGLPERAMVATQAPGSSGGINVAKLSRDTGGTGKGMGGVSVAQATSTIGSGTGGSDRPLASGGPGLGRTDEEIQIVFDKHKAALYRLYNRALRKNPTLKGQIVLRLTIEPDGSVSMCEVKASDMKAPELARKVVGRVKTFDFGAKEGVSAITIVYPIDFLPAS
jgi:hypothetical protein